MTSRANFRLLTRKDCHLCEESASLLRRLDIVFDTIDVDTDMKLKQTYGDAVPVLLLDEQEVCRAPITERALKAILKVAKSNAGGLSPSAPLSPSPAAEMGKAKRLPANRGLHSGTG